MKKLFTLLLTLTLIIASLPLGGFNITATAATSGTTGDCTWSLNGTVLTISGNGAMENYSYTSLPWGRSITEVIIQDGVTSIGGSAFDFCSKLTSVTIGNSVISIGERAFRGCYALTSITIPDSVTSIGYDVFYNTAYYKDNSNWENDVLYIGKHLIEAKDTISGEYTIKDDTLTIATYAFRDCSSLTSITIPDSVTSIGERAFSSCSSLTSVTIGDSVTSIGYGAFGGCSSLTSITIPDSVTSIGEGAFGDCSKLTSITIPDSVTSIGYGAFRGCSSLTSVTIGNGVTSIGNSAFYSCDALTEVNVSENNKNYRSENGVLYTKDKTELILYPIGKNETSYTICDGVKIINSIAFEYCTSLESITIPESVTSIGSYAFNGCSSLTTVNYKGKKEDRALILIDTGNKFLGTATWNYAKADIKGDINGDGRLDVADLALLKKMIAGLV